MFHRSAPTGCVSVLTLNHKLTYTLRNCAVAGITIIHGLYSEDELVRARSSLCKIYEMQIEEIGGLDRLKSINGRQYRANAARIRRLLC